MTRFQLTIAYDGTNFCGWQVQQNGPAIQPLIQQALETFFRHPIDLTGSGRTDAGVHARGQTAHFDTEIPFDLKRCMHALNALLPKEIRILGIEQVAPDFHARYSATGKIYHYHLHLDPVADPFLAPYHHHVLYRLDPKDLREQAKRFIGTRDFTSFANEAHRGSASHDAVRTLKRFDVVDQPGGVRLELEANGFLYKMVRNLAGTLLDITRGKLQDVDAIFAAKDRKKAGTALPPQGLFLVKVLYDQPKREGRDSRDS